MGKITSAESEFAAANSFFVDEQYEKALESYNTAIDLDPSVANYYVSRAHAHIQLEHFTDAVSDANSAIKLEPNFAKAYVRKGRACFELSEFETAKEAFEKANSLEPSADIKKWIRKCDAEITAESESAGEPTPSARHPPAPPPTSAPVASPAPAPTAPPKQPVPAPAPLPAEKKIRHEWYQTNTHVVVSLFVKDASKTDTHAEFTDNEVSVNTKLSDHKDFQWNLDVYDSIVPGESTYTISPVKIELNMKKVNPGRRWAQLEIMPGAKKPNTTPSDAAPAPIPDAVLKASTSAEPLKPPSYPTSSKKKNNWDQIDKEISKELEQEKPAGEDALNKLLQDIYSKGNEETRRAMNKSFVESGGTVLSTNWTEVGVKQVEGSAPKGMDMKKWGET
mmetsp:Transcript_32350/g.52281  ORF Transcript_32350/g.52281 Transcript_32350/m.52281 type:complete len:393 (-) Transcript_32350:570-1748(-)|eukprot:CAMPEP_0184644578 /NCGR_PEP_ID=MMETSP0308-20130426/1282_1 /TAXON_ID=38269 /ORGANISM="Gloeochaete witrockiana, Strain SAG 46.84" /LENGTH=392 /DNA_ID=CAMNT_0027073193 /DNA_START=118 /DNA_END=1296 /DNA_ORIENTATION=-